MLPSLSLISKDTTWIPIPSPLPQLGGHLELKILLILKVELQSLWGWPTIMLWREENSGYTTRKHAKGSWLSHLVSWEEGLVRTGLGVNARILGVDQSQQGNKHAKAFFHFTSCLHQVTSCLSTSLPVCQTIHLLCEHHSSPKSPRVAAHSCQWS